MKAYVTKTDLANAINPVSSKVDAVDTVVDAIKVITDNLPESGALASIAKAINCGEGHAEVIYNYEHSGGSQGILAIVEPASHNVLNGVVVDLSEMTQIGGKVKLFMIFDGSTAVLVEEKTLTDLNFPVIIVGQNLPFKDIMVTYTEGADEGADRTIRVYANYRIIG